MQAAANASMLSDLERKAYVKHEYLERKSFLSFSLSLQILQIANHLNNHYILK